MIKFKEDFINKEVLIMGLGTKGGGVGSTRFAYKNGAKITITDLEDEEYLQESIEALRDIPARFVLGRHDEKDFKSHDIIIKNPGIQDENRFVRIANNYHKIIETPIGIFSELNKRPFIGITGTKGKSFTSDLVNHLLSCFGLKTIVAGNNCVSPLMYLEEDVDFVLELSSWQLRELNKHKKSPNIACWLNFFADHLNYYNDLCEYFEDKNSILKHQNCDDFCILPFNDKHLSAMPGMAKKILFTSEEIVQSTLPESVDICFVHQGYITLIMNGVNLKLVRFEQLEPQLRIKHHFELVIAAICIVYVYLIKFHDNYSIDGNDLLEALNSYKGIEHRFEIVFNNTHCTIINDSAASTPESAICALQACRHKKIILIAGGGGHKNLSYLNLVNEIINRKVFVILFNNDDTSIIFKQYFDDVKYDKYHFVDSLKEACKMAYYLVQKEDATLLMSPACSGAPFFRDMFERGSLFKKYIFKLLDEN
jgi:UDP-N-acetylmuramoylalanine--D-glutamate ligase